MTNPQDIPEYIVIVGHGRSGTNLALDLLDCDRSTFCRNEANELRGSAFQGLGDMMKLEDLSSDFARNWATAIAKTAQSIGSRDRFPIEKNHFRSELRAKIGQLILSKQKLRVLLLPRGSGQIEEWACPTFQYDREALSQALPVFKMLLCPAWVIGAHERFPAQKIVHVHRDPEGFLQSWWSRYVLEVSAGPESVYSENLASIGHILTYFRTDYTAPKEYSLYNLIVSELWRWRYVNEVLLDKLHPSSRYMSVAYDDIISDKLSHAEELFRFGSLNMGKETRDTIRSMENTLFKKRKKDRLDHALVEDAISIVMQGSPWRERLMPNR